MKIVEFSQNLQNIKSRCIASYNAGNFLLCLNYAFLGIEKQQNSDLYAIIADCYYKMGATEKALEWYSLALINRANKVRSFIGIARCYIELKKYELAFLYTNKAIETDTQNKFIADIQSIAMFLQSDKILNQINDKHKFYTEVNIKQLDKAKYLMVNGKYEDAEILLQNISPKSSCFNESLNIKSTINIMKGNYITAYELASKVLESNPKDVNALCNVALSYSSRGNMIASMGVIKSAMAIKELSMKEKLLIATTLCQLNAHKLVIIYVQEILKTYKFNYDFLILLSIAYNNNKQYDLAIKNIDYCLEIFRFDTICLSLKNRIMHCRTNADQIPYTNQIYVPEEISLLSHNLEKIMMGDKQELNTFLNDIRNKEFVIWSLITLGNSFATMVIFNIIRSENFDFIKEILLNTRINSQIKISVIKELILQNYLEKISIVFEGLYAEIKLKKLKDKIHTQDFDRLFLSEMGMKIIN